MVLRGLKVVRKRKCQPSNELQALVRLVDFATSSSLQQPRLFPLTSHALYHE